MRSDPETDRALQHLVEPTGRSRSAAVREAIRGAEREMLLALAAHQAAGLRGAAADRAELAAAAADLEHLRAW